MSPGAGARQRAPPFVRSDHEVRGLIWSNPQNWDALSATERQVLAGDGVAEHAALDAALIDSGELVVSAGLADPITTRMIRVRDGVVASTDGPFVEAKEHLAAFTCSIVRTWNGRPRSLPASRSRVRPGGDLAGDACRRPRCEPAGRARDIEDLLRGLAPQVLGALVRRHGHFDACEDAVQEALLAAALQWPDEGVPDNPRGWLITVASRRLIDELRASPRACGARRPCRYDRRTSTSTSPADDDTLTLLFLCCHPALSAAVADRAHAARRRRPDDGARSRRRSSSRRRPWPSASAARSRRSRQRGARFALPAAEELGERLRAVLHVLYLIFNEGYTASPAPTCSAPSSRPRRSGSPAWCTRCCPTTARSPACSR